MSVTITDNRTVWSQADSATGWTDKGGGALAVFTSAPTPIESTGCIGVQVSNTTDEAKFTGTAVNLSNQLIYVWVLANGIMDTYVNGGVTLLLGDGTNRIGYHMAGSDLAGFRHNTGGPTWQCLVLDTSRLPTAFFTAYAGTEAGLNKAAITQIGAGFKTLVKAVGGVENCFVDIIRFGNNGLTITGGTSGSDPGTFDNIATLDESIADLRAYGVIRKLGEGVFGVQGKINLGTTGSTATYFEDKNATIIFENRFIGPNKLGIEVVGNTTANTEIKFGNKIGTGDTATGAAGCIFNVSPMSGSAASASFIATSGNIQNLSIYGSRIANFRGGLSMSLEFSGSNHEFIGNTISDCAQADFGQAEQRNNVIQSYRQVSNSAMIWSSSIDVKNQTFSGNTFAIEHEQTGSFTYSNLQFGSNTYDVLNESAGPVTISVVLAGDTPTVFNSGSSTTQILNNIQVTLTGMVSQSEVIVLKSSDQSEIAHVEDVGPTGEFAFSAAAALVVDIFIHAVDYVWVAVTDFTMPAADAELPIAQTFDRNYSNP